MQHHQLWTLDQRETQSIIVTTLRDPKISCLLLMVAGKACVTTWENIETKVTAVSISPVQKTLHDLTAHSFCRFARCQVQYCREHKPVAPSRCAAVASPQLLRNTFGVRMRSEGNRSLCNRTKLIFENCTKNWIAWPCTATSSILTSYMLSCLTLLVLGKNSGRDALPPSSGILDRADPQLRSLHDIARGTLSLGSPSPTVRSATKGGRDPLP